MGLVRIGEFARMSRLSAKALRRYDGLGLLAPERVDPDSGYRWYAPGQVERARLVAALRRVGMPVARIREILALPGVRRAAEIRTYWASVEAEHAARRALVARLAAGPDGAGRPGGMDGMETAMTGTYDVEVCAMPARSLLSMIRRVHEDELIPVGRELLVHRLRRGGVPRLDGVAGAPFMIYYGEVSGDSDGPVEWCWPLPDERAEEIAAAFPDLTLRTEPAHEEAYVREDTPAGAAGATQAENAIVALAAWASGHRREVHGGVRLLLVPNPDGPGLGPKSRFAVALR